MPVSVAQTELPRRSDHPSRPNRAERGETKGTMLDWLWSGWRIGLLVAMVMAAGFGVIGAWLTPRGPMTTTEALVSMVAALGVGMAAGMATGSRWSMLLAPVVFAVVFEFTRLHTVGPTVDDIHLFSLYGMIAFVLGRVVHGVLVLAPMALGAGYGVWVSGRLGNQTAATPGAFGWTLTGLATLALLVVAFFIARPASTAPILGADGEPVPDSIAELTTVSIGGHEQTLMIRGRSVDNPVLLYLSGGPGGTDIGALRADVGLEQDFVVVNWEQRGAGKSYAALDPTDTFTVDRLVADTIEVTNNLRDRFDEDKIFLAGQSWGSTLGVLAAQQHPELYHALVGVGQMVSQQETDIIFWEDTLAWAEETGNSALAGTLRRNGPPPYDDITLYEPVVGHEHDWNHYPELDLNNEIPAILFVPEYTWMDRINAFKGFLDTNATLYPQLQGIDFRTDVPRLDIPYYMVLGAHEARGRAELANHWFEILDAPTKRRIVFEGSGHRAHFDRPVVFARVMAGVLADTYTPSE